MENIVSDRRFVGWIEGLRFLLDYLHNLFYVVVLQLCKQTAGNYLMTYTQVFLIQNEDFLFFHLHSWLYLFLEVVELQDPIYPWAQHFLNFFYAPLYIGHFFLNRNAEVSEFVLVIGVIDVDDSC